MDTGVALEGDSPLFDVHGRSFEIALGEVSLPQFDLDRVPEMLPNHLKGLGGDLLGQISCDLLGGVERTTGGPRGQHLAREPHRRRHSSLARRERRSEHCLGRTSHPNVPTTLPGDLG
ncbi:hypothetical protein E1286_08770 [Nonomuraea terrae]|uniref:Uncharacterized protein n=1 Tax=Nonomuraea terrae TaxID=2530383 RepID=A0A4R4Z3Q3_9ACTN|nr:hypothetical protein [Nonomuraea terrae]TDD52603.1 hypothetical protein E1286_08770 [Nonomuraea terrae]